jgi:hypothetical protein
MAEKILDSLIWALSNSCTKIQSPRAARGVIKMALGSKMGGISQGSWPALQVSWAAVRGTRSRRRAPYVAQQWPRLVVRRLSCVERVPRTVDHGTGCLQRLYSLPEGLLGPFSLIHRALNSTPYPPNRPPLRFQRQPLFDRGADKIVGSFIPASRGTDQDPRSTDQHPSAG